MENDVRIPSGKSDFALIFESDNLNGKTLLYNYLLSELLGQVEVNQFDTLDLNSGRLNNNIYSKEKYVLALEARNYHFSDSGFFMLRGQVSGNNINKLIEKFAAEIKSIEKLDKAHFERAKKRLLLSIEKNLSFGDNRVTEYLKQQSNWNTVKGTKILDDLRSLNSGDFSKFVQQLFRGKMCFVAQSPEINTIHSHEKIKGLFK